MFWPPRPWPAGYTRSIEALSRAGSRQVGVVLGMAVIRNSDTGAIAICQEKLILDTINNLGMPLQPRVKEAMPAQAGLAPPYQ
jgi:hypothetical protein